ncbi:MAG: hypothetical protein IPM47_20350 [Sphingobacteriales bacterium]|nr:MAG: hypothetical protein IPM47_20350 [Sphingobacteriales bacterium]
MLYGSLYFNVGGDVVVYNVKVASAGVRLVLMCLMRSLWWRRSSIYSGRFTSDMTIVVVSLIRRSQVRFWSLRPVAS